MKLLRLFKTFLETTYRDTEEMCRVMKRREYYFLGNHGQVRFTRLYAGTCEKCKVKSVRSGVKSVKSIVMTAVFTVIRAPGRHRSEKILVTCFRNAFPGGG